jgi:hypothetical protein
MHGKKSKKSDSLIHDPCPPSLLNFLKQGNAWLGDYAIDIGRHGRNPMSHRSSFSSGQPDETFKGQFMKSLVQN